MTRAGAPKPLRFNHEKTESTLSVSMRSEKRFSFGGQGRADRVRDESHRSSCGRQHPARARQRKHHGRAGGKRHAVVGMGSWLFAAFRDLKREP